MPKMQLNTELSFFWSVIENVCLNSHAQFPGYLCSNALFCLTFFSFFDKNRRECKLSVSCETKDKMSKNQRF